MKITNFKKILTLALAINIAGSSSMQALSSDVSMADSTKKLLVGAALVCGAGFLLWKKFGQATVKKEAVKLKPQEKKNQQSTLTPGSDETFMHVKRHLCLHQEGLDCAFHAIKNALRINSYLHNKQPIDNKLSFSFPELEDWRDYTTREFQQNNLLRDDAVRGLLQDHIKADMRNITVIQNVHDFKPEQFGPEASKLLAALARLRNVNEHNFSHAFIVGTAPERVGGCGHWIAAVMHRAGQRLTCHYADSMNNDCRHVVQKLERLLESDFMQELEQAGAVLGKLDTIDSYVKNKAFRSTPAERVKSALAKFNEIKVLEDSFRFTIAPSYKKRAVELLIGLQYHIDAMSTEHEKKAADERARELFSRWHTPELITCKSLAVSLLHGWVPQPQPTKNKQKVKKNASRKKRRVKKAGVKNVTFSPAVLGYR